MDVSVLAILGEENSRVQAHIDGEEFSAHILTGESEYNVEVRNPLDQFSATLFCPHRINPGSWKTKLSSSGMFECWPQFWACFGFLPSKEAILSLSLLRQWKLSGDYCLQVLLVQTCSTFKELHLANFVIKCRYINKAELKQTSLDLL